MPGRGRQIYGAGEGFLLLHTLSVYDTQHAGSPNLNIPFLFLVFAIVLCHNNCFDVSLSHPLLYFTFTVSCSDIFSQRSGGR